MEIVNCGFCGKSLKVPEVCANEPTFCSRECANRYIEAGKIMERKRLVDILLSNDVIREMKQIHKIVYNGNPISINIEGEVFNDAQTVAMKQAIIAVIAACVDVKEVN